MYSEFLPDKSLSLINVKISGELTPELALDHLRTLHEKIVEHSAGRVFTDVTKVKLMGNIDDYRSLPALLRELGFPKEVKRAILVADDSDTFKKWENFLFNEGYREVKLFWVKDKAMEWLLG